MKMKFTFLLTSILFSISVTNAQTTNNVDTPPDSTEIIEESPEKKRTLPSDNEEIVIRLKDYYPRDGIIKDSDPNKYETKKGEFDIQKIDSDKIKPKIKGVHFGVTTGISFIAKPTYDYSISPIDSTFRTQKLAPLSFNISTCVAFPIAPRWWGTGLYVKRNKTYYTGTGLYGIVSLNLATFNTAFETGGLFNKQIDGGLGLGWALTENACLIGTFEMLSVRQPRDYMLDIANTGEKIMSSNGPIMEIDESSNYLTNYYVPSFSIKFAFFFDNTPD